MKYLNFFISICLIFYSCNGEKVEEEKTSSVEEEYNEPHRPQFHFSPPSMWMNDPNGMVYHEGKYHLFYQYNPDSTVWGPMHWGHAISTDMIHWEHLPVALYPDSLGTIFSGSAVVDINNTSGLGTSENPAIVAIFTYHNAELEKQGKDNYQTQGIAFSTDKGRSWEKFEGNPVLSNPGIKDFRDPKVIWYEEGQIWIMALAVKDHISFYSSPDLKDWKLESDFGSEIGAHGGVWECPDLFELPVAGSDEKKWVLLVSINPGGPNGGSATQYFIGDFDGSRFTLDQEFKADLTEKGIWLDYGRDNYAGVTWSNIPEEDSRRLFMGWMSNWNYANVVPTEKWRSAMTIARELTLNNTPEGLRVLSNPVEEIKTLYTNTFTPGPGTISYSLIISDSIQFTGSIFELKLELEASENFAIELSNDRNEKLVIGYEKEEQRYYIDRSVLKNNTFSTAFGGISYGPRILESSSFSLTLLVDVASVELFADNGMTAMTEIFFPQEKLNKIKIIAGNEEIKIKSLVVTELKSIWE